MRVGPGSDCSHIARADLLLLEVQFALSQVHQAG